MKRTFTLTIITFLIPMLVFAHGSHGSGFMAGFTHPIFGLDHNLAILGIGTLSYLLDTKKWYIYPITFLILMIIGGISGIGKDSSIVIEKMIALSVLVIGLTHLKKINSGNLTIALMIGVFGFFHGYAHGAEIPENTTQIKYISGFAIGAIILSILGFFIGKSIMNKSSQPKYITLISGILLGAGIVFLWP